MNVLKSMEESVICKTRFYGREMPLSPENILEPFSFHRGPKRAYVYSFDQGSTSYINEANSVHCELKQLGFVLPDDIDDYSNLNPIQFHQMIKKDTKEFRQSSCLLLYIMGTQSGRHLNAEPMEKLHLNDIWSSLAEDSSLTHIPKLIFIQADVSDTKAVTVMLNKDGNIEEADDFTLPHSCNMLLFYYPKYGKTQPPLREFLFEELRKWKNMNDGLTSVMSNVKACNYKGTMFSSSLIKELHLIDSVDLIPLLPTYGMDREKRRLAYVFMFHEFKAYRNLKKFARYDAEALKETFGPQGLRFELEFCVINGIMSVAEFKAKLWAIIESIEQGAGEVECIAMIISSHGSENGIIYAYDGAFQLCDVWTPLSECDRLNGVPKLLFIDACRGNNLLEGKGVASGGEVGMLPPGRRDKDGPHMSDILIALSTTEGSESFGKEDDRGSVFIQEVCRMILSHWEYHDILTILNATMRTVSETFKKVVPTNGRVTVALRQQITFTSTFHKKFYFQTAFRKQEDDLPQIFQTGPQNPL